ncbi:hypothetical protein SPYCA_3498 [Sphingopyxis sp. FD7]|nr:hypothetical protein SPYCA_3498 [Sphingopyxis sp. FD7]
MVVRNETCFGFKVIAEQVAVEVEAELPENLEQSVFGVFERPLAQDIAQMRSRTQPEIFQIALADDASVEEITGEDEPAEQGVKHIEGDGARLSHAEFGADVSEIGEEIAIDTLAGIERPGMFAEENAGLDREEELREGCYQMLKRGDERRQVHACVFTANRARHTGVNLGATARY